MNPRRPRCNRIPILLLIALAIAACSHKREDTLKTALAAVSAAHQTYVGEVKEREHAVVERHDPSDRAGYDAEMDRLREREAIVTAAIVAAYKAIGVAAVIAKDQPALDVVAQTVDALGKALEAWKAGAP
jgi:hypothetical protein